MKTSIFKRVLCACAFMLLGSIAWAGSSTTTFNVTASVGSSCTVTAGGQSTITYTLNTPYQGQDGGVSIPAVSCNATPTSLALTPGNADTTGAGVLTCQSGGCSVGVDTIAYQLYQPVLPAGTTCQYTTVWGNQASTNTVDNPAKGTSYAICVGIGALSPSAGTYQDTVTVTVNY